MIATTTPAINPGSSPPPSLTSCALGFGCVVVVVLVVETSVSIVDVGFGTDGGE